MVDRLPHPRAGLRSTRPWAWVLGILVVAAAIRIHALAVGFVMDDYAQLAMLAGAYPVEREPWDLFSFCRTPQELSGLVTSGAFPWWSDPELRLSTLRPLPSLLIWLDVRAFGLEARWHHAHTFVWWVAMLLVVARLLLRVLPVRWALLAFALYALDECHAQPLAWLANRNAILATTFGMLAVHAHVRWREAGPERSRWLAVLLIILALGCGEAALGAFGFLLAYELVRRDRSLGALWPLLVVLLVWALLHRGGGYGADFSGVYVDPVAEPRHWLAAAVVRAPILLADLAFAVPTGQLALGGRAMALQAVLGGVALVAALLWLGPARVRRTELERERIRWFAVAAVLSLLPMLSAFVSARLLVMPAIAAHVLLAAVVLEGLDARLTPGAAARARTALAAALVVAHLGLAPWWGIREIAELRSFGAAVDRAAVAMPIDDAVIAGKTVIVLGAADPSTLLYPPLIRSARGLTRPRRWMVLSAAPGPGRLRRVDAQTLEIEVESGMLRADVEQMFRREDRPVRVHEVIAWGDARVEVLAADAEGFPVRVRYSFATSLDDPSVVVLLATPSGFVRYPLGPVGVAIALPPASAPR